MADSNFPDGVASPFFNPENVQFPTFTAIDPAAVRVSPEAMHSAKFIERFNAKDTAPIQVTDDASQALRNKQIVKLTRSLLGQTTSYATDDQVLRLHRDFFAGRY